MPLIFIEGDHDLKDVFFDTIKARLRVGSDGDAALEGAIKAAYALINGPAGLIGRALLSETWDYTIDGFPSAPIRIPLPPLEEVVAVRYVDPAGDEQVVAEDRYRIVKGTPARVVAAPGLCWPAVQCGIGSVTIRFKAGYGETIDDIPAPIVTAITLQARHMLSLGEQSLFLRSEKVEGVGEQQFTVSDVAGKAIGQAVADLLQPYRVYG